MSDTVFVWVYKKDRLTMVDFMKPTEELKPTWALPVNSALFPQVTHENSPVKFALVEADVLEKLCFGAEQLIKKGIGSETVAWITFLSVALNELRGREE